MFDIAPAEVLLFVRQASAAVAGAAGLHAWLLYSRKQKTIAKELHGLMIWSSAVFIFTWLVGWFLTSPSAFAHVGISLLPRITDIDRAYLFQWPFVLFLAVLILFARGGLARVPKVYSILFFSVMSILLSTYAVSAAVDFREVSYVLHGWHSVVTLGTVVVLDYLFFSLRNDKKRLALFTKSFARFSVFIFVGLALDILSTYFVLGEAFVLNVRFFFVQTVVVVLIINGVLLSGPMTRVAGRYLARAKELPKGMSAALGLMGAASLVSWVTITFLDFVPDISLSYMQMATVYVALIAAGFLTNLVVDGWPLGTRRAFGRARLR